MQFYQCDFTYHKSNITNLNLALLLILLFYTVNEILPYDNFFTIDSIVKNIQKKNYGYSTCMVSFYKNTLSIMTNFFLNRVWSLIVTRAMT